MTFSKNVLNAKSTCTLKFIQLIFSLVLNLFIILSAVKFTLFFKPLYYFDIGYLNIAEQSNFSKDEIIKNYDYTINFLLDHKEEVFKLPSIPYSEVGQVHFKDVKNIFLFIDKLWLITGIVSALYILFSIKKRNLDFLKKASTILWAIPLMLSIAFVIDFDTSFTIFHKIFFRNGFWQFDPEFDPIITILPQDFFFHSALLILLIIFACSLVFRIIYKRSNRKFTKLFI